MMTSVMASWPVVSGLYFRVRTNQDRTRLECPVFSCFAVFGPHALYPDKCKDVVGVQ